MSAPTLAGRAATRQHRIAVMQPYFFPYAGYFRLLAQADQFVLFDCVQFPRRGRVHRCEVPGPAGAHWLTLPLAAQPRDVRIADLAFADDARARMDSRLAALPWIAAATGTAAASLRAFLHAPLDGVVDYLEDGLRLAAGLLGIDCKFCRSSSLGLPAALRGQDRVLAIASALGASHYLNAPGGRALYDPARFAQAGIALEFLPAWTGPGMQLLPALMQDDPAFIADAIIADSLRAESPAPAPSPSPGA